MSPSFKARLISYVGGTIINLLCATLRFRVHDPAGFLKQPPSLRMIGIFWHNRLLIIPHFFTHYMKPRIASALTSASKDGEILAAFLARFGIKAIRGSSSRRGVAALLEMRHALAEGRDVAITPDGPRGPRYHLNPGVIALAQKTATPALPIVVHYHSSWRLRSWDAFEIPKPFSLVTVKLLPLHYVAPTRDEEGFEKERVRLEEILRTPAI